ncbi:hypothetical protein JCM24511_05944 [Saitozyma sp. JCM 24511]|nr:hypothetical protein JCM24511_05944 [Saitozyma sp. JCM 24511]
MIGSTSLSVLRPLLVPRSLAASSSFSVRGLFSANWLTIPPFSMEMILAPKAPFITSARSLVKREVLVELLEDVDGLGLIQDRVAVAPGRARNQLLPNRQARYVPWKRNSQREPRKAEPRAPSLLSAFPSTSSPAPTAPLDLSLLLSLPPTLSFPLRTTSPSSSALHGSLTLGDVQSRLAEFGLVPGSIEVSWRDHDDAERMKELGVWAVVVRPAGAVGGEAGEITEAREVAIDVEVTRLEQV